MRNSLLNAVAAASLLMAVSPALAKGSWVPIVPPANSTSSAPFGINDKNVITGYYIDSSNAQHGFVGALKNDGNHYTTIDDGGGTTEPRAISDKGYITGYDVSTITAWERDPKGKLTYITKGGTGLDQLAQEINKAGIFAGDYTDSSTGLFVGYLGKNAKYKSTISLSISNNGYAGRAIDSAGDVGGWYYDSNSVQQGYIIVGGTASSVEYPSAAYTVVEGMNDKGYVSGQYEDSSAVIHGFIYDIKTQKFTSLTAPNATLTQVWGINNNDVVAVSSSAGGFIYCMNAKKCPKTSADFTKTQHVSAKYTPIAP